MKKKYFFNKNTGKINYKIYFIIYFLKMNKNYFSELPNEILENIFSKLKTKHHLELIKVCKKFYYFFKSQTKYSFLIVKYILGKRLIKLVMEYLIKYYFKNAKLLNYQYIEKKFIKYTYDDIHRFWYFKPELIKLIISYVKNIEKYNQNNINVITEIKNKQFYNKSKFIDNIESFLIEEILNKLFNFYFSDIDMRMSEEYEFDLVFEKFRKSIINNFIEYHIKN